MRISDCSSDVCSSDLTVTKEKTPLFGDIPVLGAFFKRQQNQKEKQELIIVATPRLVGPMKPEEVPPLPGAATAGIDPGVGEMILGTGGLDSISAPFAVVRGAEDPGVGKKGVCRCRSQWAQYN